MWLIASIVILPMFAFDANLTILYQLTSVLPNHVPFLTVRSVSQDRYFAIAAKKATTSTFGQRSAKVLIQS